jgi:polysaccharide export outer membrane protein
MRKRKYFYCIIGAFLIFALGSCVSNKDLIYFRNVTRDSSATITNPISEAKINKNDILQITITSLDEQTTKIFNSNNLVVLSSAAPGTNSGATNGTLVDEAGNIVIPLIGIIKAEGLTKTELASKIQTEILTKKLAINPIVSVRVVSYKITILGEVNKPGVIQLTSEHITIPEALGMAGDLTPYAKRNTLLLVRETGGKRTFTRFSLNDTKLFDKEFYNLQDHDLIVVEPNNAKAGASDRTTQLLPIIISSLSLIAVIVSQIARK